MPKYKGGLTTDGKKFEHFVESIDKQKLTVGFLGGQFYPNGLAVASNAVKQEFGVMSKQQPPRPFMRPAIRVINNKAPQVVADLSVMAFESGMSMSDVFTNLGLLAVSDVVRSIESVNSPELAPRTIEARKKRGNFSVKPLEDTLKMKNSVDFEVSKIV